MSSHASRHGCATPAAMSRLHAYAATACDSSRAGLQQAAEGVPGFLGYSKQRADGRRFSAGDIWPISSTSRATSAMRTITPCIYDASHDGMLRRRDISCRAWRHYTFSHLLRARQLLPAGRHRHYRALYIARSRALSPTMSATRYYFFIARGDRSRPFAAYFGR